MAEQWLIEKRAELRRDDRGEFDELVVYDQDGKCVVHAEMMDDKTLWMRIECPGTKGDTGVVVWISARGKLKISAEDD